MNNENCNSNSLSSGQLDQLRNETVGLAVSWIKSGTQYYTMRQTVNEYLDAIHANTGMDDEGTVARRKIATQVIVIRSIRELSEEEQDRLQSELYRIAEDDAPKREYGNKR